LVPLDDICFSLPFFFATTNKIWEQLAFFTGRASPLLKKIVPMRD
jgi:hypothetical protein